MAGNLARLLNKNVTNRSIRKGYYQEKYMGAGKEERKQGYCGSWQEIHHTWKEGNSYARGSGICHVLDNTGDNGKRTPTVNVSRHGHSTGNSSSKRSDCSGAAFEPAGILPAAIPALSPLER